MIKDGFEMGAPFAEAFAAAQRQLSVRPGEISSTVLKAPSYLEVLDFQMRPQPHGSMTLGFGALRLWGGK